MLRILSLLGVFLLAAAAWAQKPPPLGAPGSPSGLRGSGLGKPPPLPGGTRGQPRAGAPGGGLRTASTGTGFVVGTQRVLTNHHVVDGCRRVLVRNAENQQIQATVAAQDRRRDLALLATRGNPGPALAFRDRPAVRRGDGVVTYGFPLSGLLSSGPTLTTGEISALAGLRDNQVNFQISAPVQPGNSGGPLLDLAGNVVGVIVSKLAAMRVAQQTGDIPQNVNFAVKGSEAVDFLRRNGVQPRLAASDGPERRASEVGEMAHASTVFIQCQK